MEIVTIFRNERHLLTSIATLSAAMQTLLRRVDGIERRVAFLEARSNGGDTTVHQKLDLISGQLGLLLQQGASLMATAAQLEAELEQINATTSEMATTLAGYDAKLVEIDNDIDALLTRGTEPIPDALLARFQQHRETLAGLRSTTGEVSTRLDATAAKHTPETVPPPVEEPPVEEPPAEEPPPTPPIV